MARWNGTLNLNKILRMIQNMIISQEVNSANVDHKNSLAQRAMVDGTLYGDQKLYYETDATETYPYDPDSQNQLNLLATHRPADPAVQAIKIDQARWTAVTTDAYLTKQAFDERTFSEFNSVSRKWLFDNKRMHTDRLYNCYIGTHETTEGKQEVEVDVSDLIAPETTIDAKASNELVAGRIAEVLANLEAEMADYSRDFNNLGYIRTFSLADCEVVWPASVVNKIRKTQLPSIFHKDGLFEFKRENILPDRYFGTVNASIKVADAATRSLIEQTIEYDGTKTHYWPGDSIVVGATAPAGTSYQEQGSALSSGSVVCKIVHKKAVPFMSAFETTVDFFNPKNLSTNTYVHFMYNTLEQRDALPFITVKMA